MLVLFLRRKRIVRQLWRDRHNLRAQFTDLRETALKAPQMEVAVRAPSTAIENHHHMSLAQQRVKAHRVALRIRQDEVRRRVARLQRATGQSGGGQSRRFSIHHAQRRLPDDLTAILRSRSEEHTSELQSRFDLVCRLLLEKDNPPWLHRRRCRPGSPFPPAIMSNRLAAWRSATARTDLRAFCSIRSPSPLVPPDGSYSVPL